VEVNYHTLYTIVRTEFKDKLKVPRTPSHHACPDHLDILLVDNSGAHTAQRLRWPENIHDVWLPPYCPELNPIERVWRDLKDELAWLQCTDLDAQQAYVVALLHAYDAPTLLALTGDAYLVGPINALCA
jgi:DDE superfamily endonuclease